VNRQGAHAEDASWQQFVLANGWRARLHELAAVVGRPEDEVERVRRTTACARLKQSKAFAELFALWRGRAPSDNEWPKPGKAGSGGYEWQPPELALLASLVGQLAIEAIAQILTGRLRERTGDPSAQRTRTSVQVYINKIGLQTTDVLNGITTAAAGREIGSRVIVHDAIRKKQLRARRVGRLWVIPHAAWSEWKAKRVFPPDGYVLLNALRESLAIRSDKLSEFARMGYVPTAIRCNPFGVKGPSTKFGTWYVDKKVADQLLADRRAGRPMPWHGKPLADNLRAAFKLWQSRKHPPACATCAEIWGEKGVPQSYEAYADQYHPLAHGAKRHLSRAWTPGLTVPELATYAGRSASHVRRAISNGMLKPSLLGGRQYVTRTDATRWIARKCPTGDGEKSWVSLETACKQHLFTKQELRGFIADNQLISKVGTDGAMRGVVYVSRHQCAQLREKLGFTEEQAARRAGVTVQRLRLLLDGVNWRGAEGIPLPTLQAVIKRLESREGHTLEEAAEILGTTLQWVKARKDDGTIKVSQAKWDRRRVYITEPMLKRLQQAMHDPAPREQLSSEWLRLSDAAQEAGVSTTTLMNWATSGDLKRRESSNGFRYHREAVRARARTYWLTVRFHRATPPEWLGVESPRSRGRRVDASEAIGA